MNRYLVRSLRRDYSSIKETPVVSAVKKQLPRRIINAADPRKDFKYFVMRAKVSQVYREALQEAKAFPDPSMKLEMQDLMRDEFRVFRRDPLDLGWKLEADKIDYHLALIRKQINMIKELRDRVA
jgi:hypothetical protein